MTKDLTVDPKRLAAGSDEMTNIFVRAKNGDKWDSYNLGSLDKESVLRWIDSNKDSAEFSRRLILTLLQHQDQT